MIDASLLNEVLEESRHYLGKGNTADYIPALANVSGDNLGIAVCDLDGNIIGAGDYQTPFTIQSISKILSLTMALDSSSDADKEVWSRVGRNQSGDGFNSLVQVELENGIPRNPFINAGALVIADILFSRFGNLQQGFLDLAIKLSGNPNMNYNKVVAESELQFSARNASIAYLMKSFGNFHNNVECVLKDYFKFCSLNVTCEDLSKIFIYLANGGVCLQGSKVASKVRAKRINSLLATSGLYDGSGEFAFRIGVPGKSGVGGGIIAIFPRKMIVSVWSPELDSYGNSLAGMAALERLSHKIGYSIY